MDKLSPQQRHKNMAAIRSKDTKPEMIVRRGLWSRGFRYRLNYKRLPGHPDLVLRKYRTCIFVNGCFWHGHHLEVKSDKLKVKSEELEVKSEELEVKSEELEVKSEELEVKSEELEVKSEKLKVKSEWGEVKSSECCKIPKTNREFWVAKIWRNKERDKEEQKKLAAMGWHCITVWECELTPKRREETLESIAFTLNHIWLQDHQTKVVRYPKQEEEDLQMPMAAENPL